MFEWTERERERCLSLAHTQLHLKKQKCFWTQLKLNAFADNIKVTQKIEICFGKG